jgi:hypothetical protein
MKITTIGSGSIGGVPSVFAKVAPVFYRFAAPSDL